MIEKRIFYCWFGENDPSPLEDACMKSWPEKCPEYEIVRISEDNFDVYCDSYCKEAYIHGNYSFVSDVARLRLLEKQSGIYLDTDIMLLRSLDELLKYDAFISMSGKGFYNTTPIGCAGFPEFLSVCKDSLKDGRCLNELVNETVYSRFDVHGNDLEVQDNIAFLGNAYFVTGGYSVERRTIGIHYCLGSWLDKWQGSYKKEKTFKAFEVYQDGVRDFGTEKKIYGDAEKIGTFKTFGRPFKKDYIFYGNYFYNEKVMAVAGDGFRIERFDAPPIPEKYIFVEDVRLECVD